MAKYTPDKACFDAANAASGGKLTKEEIEAAFQKAADYKERLQRTGDVDNIDTKLRSFAEREAERTKIAAAMQRRHAALNILVRDRLDAQIESYRAEGMTPQKSLLAILEGTQKGVQEGRVSAAAAVEGFEGRYSGGMMAELQEQVPHFQRLLNDEVMDAAIAREMSEIKEGGKPGITGNRDAKIIADIFSKYAEMARTDLNKRGASIGKLDGWFGSQSHDDMKMIEAGKDAWISSVKPRLDLDKTFPDVANEAEVDKILGDTFDTIITGLPNKKTAAEKGQRVNPANLAKSLGKSRVLHFKDVNSALDYQKEFGYGNVFSGMAAHLRRSAKLAGVMQTLGPNPEVMFDAITASIARKIKEGDLPNAVKNKQIKKLNTEAGSMRHALDVATGLISRPVNVTGAKISGDIRAAQSMSKLGFAIASSLGDTITSAAASQFRGSGFMRGLVTQLDGVRRGRSKGELEQISSLLGEGFDGIIGHIVSPHASQDGPVGKLSKMQESFFKWTALTWWTDVNRAVAARTIAAEMGMHSAKDFDTLYPAYKHVLGLHGIDKADWNAIRQGNFREVNGKTYVTPDRIRLLDDAAIEPLAKGRIDAAYKSSKIDEAKSPEVRDKRTAAFEKRKAELIDDARTALELKVLSFVRDETSYGVIVPDARSRRTTTWGTRPGTLAGEAIRFAMQFKGFPIAFSQRVGARALFGARKDASFLEKSGHIGTLIGGLTMAGYMSLVLKDLQKGYWPPRDPTDPKTWGAAFVQGGAAGIYGDYLFSRVNRFGGGITQTALGPTFGTAGDLADLLLKARDATVSSDPKDDIKAADFLTFALQNTPFINVSYVRPALDFLALNALREAATPGYLRKIDAKRKADYNQTRFAPQRAF